jgi:hypothetical protein
VLPIGRTLDSECSVAIAIKARQSANRSKRSSTLRHAAVRDVARCRLLFPFAVYVSKTSSSSVLVLDRLQLLPHFDSGVAVVVVAGVRLKCQPLTLQCNTSSFKFVAARMTSSTSNCLVIVGYRPGSIAVTVSYFSELADILDRVATFSEPVLLTGDVNIRLAMVTNPYRPTIQFNALMAS